MVVTITNYYSTKALVVGEAGVAGRTFADDDVEAIIQTMEGIINNYTSKTTVSPWTSGDVEQWPIVTDACKVGSAGKLMMRFPSLVAQGKVKVDYMYSILNNFVYGEASPDGSSGLKGDVIVVGGAFENPEFENITNLDINANDTIGT